MQADRQLTGRSSHESITHPITRPPRLNKSPPSIQLYSRLTIQPTLIMRSRRPATARGGKSASADHWVLEGRSIGKGSRGGIAGLASRPGADFSDERDLFFQSRSRLLKN